MSRLIRHVSKVTLVSLMAIVLTMSGCWTAQQWLSLVSTLLPIIGQTYLQFYGFASKGGVDAGDIALVQNLTSAGQDAITQVEAIMAAVKAGDQTGIGKAKSILAALQASVNSFLTDAQIKNSAHFAAYSGFAQAILADVTDVIALIPVVAVAGARGATISVSYSKAKGLPAVFNERLAKLPK